MAIRIGANKPEKIFCGEKRVKKVYYGQELIWEDRVPFYIYKDGAGGTWQKNGIEMNNYGSSDGYGPQTAGGTARAHAVARGTTYGYCNMKSNPFSRRGCEYCTFYVVSMQCQNAVFVSGNPNFRIGNKEVKITTTGQVTIYIGDLPDIIDCELRTSGGSGSSEYPASTEVNINGLRCY